MKLCGNIQVALLGNCRAGSWCAIPWLGVGSVRAQCGADSEVGTQQSPTALATAPSVVPLDIHLPVVHVVSLISGTASKQSSGRRSPLVRPAAARGMEKATPAGR